MLQEAVESESNNREAGYEKMLKKIKDEMNRMYELVENQNKLREDSHKMYTALVDEMDQRIRQELIREKKEREMTEETLIKLLEDTCLRVESGLTHNTFSS
jgi:transcription initiation factor IIF auxiliary subunit